MKMIYVLPLLFFAACTPETGRVFTPRASARAVEPYDAGPHRAQEVDERLRDSTDRAARIQDLLDEPVRMQGDDDP
jgi:hypothetical protein